MVVVVLELKRDFVSATSAARPAPRSPSSLVIIAGRVLDKPIGVLATAWLSQVSLDDDLNLA